MAAIPRTAEETRQRGAPPGAAPSWRLRRTHARLLAQAERLVELAAAPEERLWRVAERVSGWSVGQHLEHLMLANRTVLDRLDKMLAGRRAAASPPPPAPPASPASPASLASPDASARPARAAGISFSGRLVLWFNYIPRGSARATTPIQPKSTSAAPIRAGLEEVRRRLAGLGQRLAEVRQARGTARHLIFGELDAREWLRFLAVHNHHHLKIIRDVEAALAPPAGRRG